MKRFRILDSIFKIKREIKIFLNLQRGTGLSNSNDTYLRPIGPFYSTIYFLT